MTDIESMLPDPGHEEPVCEACEGTGRLVLAEASGWYGPTPCHTCNGTGRPRCPDCERGTARTGPGTNDVEMCDRCDGDGLL